MIITLPHEYSPRTYQKPSWRALFDDNIKRIIMVWHRRAGKDKHCINLMIAASQCRVGNYYYVFPELKQARRDIWEGIGADGHRFLTHFPPSLIKRINNTEMVVEFKNGSLMRLVGADRYDALMGSNPVGVVLAEYSLQRPQAWDYLRPILAENGGWAIFQFTPRGHNHAYELYQTARDNPKWFVQCLTVRDTKRPNGKPVISEEVIEEERNSGMSQEMIQQEYYCSFEAAIKGSYFGRYIEKLEKENKITDFPIDTTLPVYTYWDLGYRDPTAIWFVQFALDGIRIINYYENNNEDLQHYVNYIYSFRDSKGIVYGKHYAPHDGNKHEYGTGKTIVEIARRMGLPFLTIPRIKNKQDAIEMARAFIKKVQFHKSNCKYGLLALKEYRARYNETMHTFSNTPLENWACHGADAFMQIAQWEFGRRNRNAQSPSISTKWDLK